MKPIALPSLGGMAVSVVTMFIVPCLFSAVEEWKWKRARRTICVNAGNDMNPLR